MLELLAIQTFVLERELMLREREYEATYWHHFDGIPIEPEGRLRRWFSERRDRNRNTVVIRPSRTTERSLVSRLLRPFATEGVHRHEIVVEAGGKVVAAVDFSGRDGVDPDGIAAEVVELLRARIEPEELHARAA